MKMLIAILASAALLSGCGQSQEPATPEAPAAPPMLGVMPLRRIGNVERVHSGIRVLSALVLTRYKS